MRATLRRSLDHKSLLKLSDLIGPLISFKLLKNGDLLALSAIASPTVNFELLWLTKSSIIFPWELFCFTFASRSYFLKISLSTSRLAFVASCGNHEKDSPGSSSVKWWNTTTLKPSYIYKCIISVYKIIFFAFITPCNFLLNRLVCYQLFRDIYSFP